MCGSWKDRLEENAENRKGMTEHDAEACTGDYDCPVATCDYDDCALDWIRNNAHGAAS